MRLLCETEILTIEEMRREGARRWLRLTLSGLAGPAQPGQTMLFAEERHSPRCRIATVEAVEGARAVLVARFEADDRVPKAGAGLTVWSNEEPAVSPGPGSLVVTTPAFQYRVAPFAQLGAELIVEEPGVDLWEVLRQRLGESGDWTSIFLALEPVRLEAFAAAFPGADPYLYANMDMSCGIGACRSCHVNLTDCKDGEASCRRGPWFALQRVNLVRLRFASVPYI